MSKIFRFFAAICLFLISVASFAESFEVGGIYYKTDYKDKTIAIVTSGDNKYAGEVIIPETVAYNGSTLKVTTIGSFAFSQCTGLTSVKIPNSITTIEFFAFNGCSGITTIALPNSILRIGDGAFSGCNNLLSIEIPNSIVEMGNSVFSSSGIQSVVWPQNVKVIPDGTFSSCTGLKSYDISDNITDIGSRAFSSCSNLISVHIGKNVRTIGDDAFDFCSALESINIPTSVRSIGKQSFYYCKSLKEIVLNDGLELIGSEAFRNTGFQSITIPRTVKYVGVALFADCGNLKSISVEKSNGHYCDINGVLYSAKKDTIIAYPSGLGDEYAIPNDTKAIGDYAFYRTNIKVVSLNEGLEYIGEKAFGSTQIESIEIPSMVSKFGEYIFESQRNLKSIISKIDTPKDILKTVFDYFSSGSSIDNIYNECVLYVPEGTSSKYKAANGWKKFSHIKECDRVEVNGFEYEVSYGTHQATLLKKSTSVSYNEEVEIPEEISYQEQLIPVIGIAEDAFKEKNLKSVILGKNIQTIGDNAFGGCRYLKMVTVRIEAPITIDENVFDGVYDNATLIVPQTKKAVYSAAAPWNKFERIKEADSEIVVDDLLYEIDFSMSTATLLKKNTYVYSSDEIEIPESITYQGKKYLVTEVAENAFKSTSLKSIVLGKNIRMIGNNAFKGCHNLKSVVVRMETPISISDNVFEGVYENAILIVPRGKRADYSGTEPWSKFLPNIKEVDSEIMDNGIVFEVDYVNKSAKVIGCNKYDIPSEIIIPEALTYDNELITVQSIGKEAFKDVTRLRSIEIPKSVQTIGERSFSNCTQLTTVISDILVPIAIDENVFEGVYSRASLIVPIDKGSAYTQADGWKKFNSIEEVKPEQDFTLDDLTFHAELKWKRASVIGYNGDDEHLDIPESFVKYGIKLEVRQVVKSAFVNKSIRTISFPSTITSIAQGAFQNCNNLCALTWNSAIQFPSVVLTDINNPNLLLYLNSISAIPSGGSNYIINGVADAISLSDNEVGDFYCPQEFIAKQIRYTHNYSMETLIGKSQGWETIVLPFDVQQIKSKSGNIVPFEAVINDNDRFFWLREMSETGFTDAAEIKANKPYIISMPNSKWYSDVYRISGDVEFYSENVSVLASSELTGVINGSKTFMPSYQKKDANNNTYVLNVYDISGDYAPGSVFVRNFRDIRPFECYIEDKVSQTRAFYISDYITDIENKSIGSENDVIYSEGNTIVIESRTTQRIPIYNLSGQLVRLVNVTAGRNQIAGLIYGIYIIKGKKYFIL